jgi:acetyl esterase/lipase
MRCALGTRLLAAALAASGCEAQAPAPTRLAEYIAGCPAFRSEPPSERALFDVELRRRHETRAATDEEVRALERRGARVVHRFHVNAVRAEMDTGTARLAIAEGIAFAARQVSDPGKLELTVQIQHDGPLNTSDSAFYRAHDVPLGPTARGRGIVQARIDDELIARILRQPGVRVVRVQPVGCEFGDAPLAVTSSVNFSRDHRYVAPEADTASRTLDVYRIGGSAGSPLVVLIHGGGLRRGDKADENMAHLCEMLARERFVCASINYRLQHDHDADLTSRQRLDSAVADADSALGWLRRHADRFGIDTSRIAVGGSSAGANIALELAYGRPTRVGAVFSWVGAVDNPAELIDRGEPPLIIIHGAADTIVPVAHARAMAQRAAVVGIPSRILVCEGLGHNVPLDRRFGSPQHQSLYTHLARFLKDALARVVVDLKGDSDSRSCPQ